MLKIAVISDSSGFLEWLKPILTKEGHEVFLYFLLKKDLLESVVQDKAEILIVDFFSDIDASKKIVASIKKDNSINCHLIAVFNEKINDNFDFKIGIDDFIFKDSIEREIGLKIGLYQWKCHKVDLKDRIIFNDFTIDSANYEVTFKGERITLTYKEFELLKFLITHRGRVYSRDALLNQVWGYNYYGGTRTVDVHIRRLRSKIGLAIDDYLTTVRNVGYKFEK